MVNGINITINSLAAMAIVFLSGCVTSTPLPIEITENLKSLALVHTNPNQSVAIHSRAINQPRNKLLNDYPELAVSADLFGKLIVGKIDQNRKTLVERKALQFQMMYSPESPHEVVYQQLNASFLDYAVNTYYGDLVVQNNYPEPTLQYELFYILSPDTKTLQLSIKGQFFTAIGVKPYIREVYWQTKNDSWNEESFTEAMESGSRELADLLVQSYLNLDISIEKNGKYNHYILLDPYSGHNMWSRAMPTTTTALDKTMVYMMRPDRFMATDLKTTPLEEFSAY